MGGLLAHTVYHGSPHKFNKFDMSKIGTGEGAQAYGHGLYLAEAKDVGKEYMRKLAGSDNGMAGSIAAQNLQMYKTPESAIEALQNQLTPNLTGESRKVTEDAISLLKNGQANTGYLYKVDIPDEAIPRMLDWDKPLSEQSQDVKNVLSSAGLLPDGAHRNVMGEDLVKRLGVNAGKDTHPFAYKLPKRIEGMAREAGFNSGNTKNIASDYLNSLGIPGIRYLDGSSRNVGEGTSNFVLFDDQLPRILEINGQPTGLLSYADEAKKKKK